MGPLHGTPPWHRYRGIVPRADFGEHVYPGGQIRFTEIEGGDARIFTFPAEVFEALSFEFEIHADALGGMMICAEGLEVRARA